MVGANREDEKITQQVSQKLANRGCSTGCHVSVNTSKGVVTLSGTVQQFHQKKLASNVCSGVQGVRRVVDQLIVQAPAKRT